MIKKEEKSDEQVLFPEVEVAGIKVKPWSFGALFDLSPLLGEVLDKAEERGIVDDFEDSTGFVSVTTMAKIFTIASSEALKIIAYTTGKTEEELKELNMGDGIKLAMVIFNQNKETIKNALAPLRTPVEEEEEIVEEEEVEEPKSESEVEEQK